LGLDVGDLTKGNFDRMGMIRMSLVWHNGLETNVADGWDDQGQQQAHDKRSNVRGAGSMNTTISDMSKFAAALVNGDGLSAASRAEMTKPRLHITTAHQFPLFLPDLPLSEQRKDLYSGLGVTVTERRVTVFIRRPRRPDRQHTGLHRGQSALRLHPVE
jgi:CubicO group peptidase (beta-lactamase class C family)